MAAVFLKLLNLSISASWLVLAVLVLRMVSKRSPKWINVLLWGIVALRLVLPFSVESVKNYRELGQRNSWNISGCIINRLFSE